MRQSVTAGRRRPTAVLIVTALAATAVAALAGCTTGPPGHPTSASPQSSTPRPTAAGTEDSNRLGVGEGTGPGTVNVVWTPAVGTPLTVRLTCVGPGRVRILDGSGGLILGTGGCASGVVYSSAWRSTAHDGPTVAVVVAPGTRWAVDVWRGRPPAGVAPAPVM